MSARTNAPATTALAPPSSLFASDAWAHALLAGYGLQVEVAVRSAPDGDDSIRYCRVDDLRGPRIVSLPFSDYCDPTISSRDGWDALVAPLLAERIPVTLRVLHAREPALDARFAAAGEVAWHQTTITGDDDQQWERLAPQARQNVRRATRSGVSVRFTSDLAEVERFHALHVTLRKQKYRMLAQPRAFFEALWEAFAPQGELWLALAEERGDLIAGTLFLECGDRLYYKFNASTSAPSRPNDALVWEGLRLANARGLRALDFGLSDLAQDGLVRFKEKYATEHGRITSYRSIPADRPPAQRDDAGDLLHALAGLFTDPEVPDAIAARAGDVLYRYFC